MDEMEWISRRQFSAILGGLIGTLLLMVHEEQCFPLFLRSCLSNVIRIASQAYVFYYHILNKFPEGSNAN